MDVSTREAEALVRTSVQTVANRSRMATFEENDDIIKHVQALVTLDNRTSIICIARSGAVWDLKTGAPVRNTSQHFPGPPPWHWNCRTTLIPIMESWSDLSRTKGGKRGFGWVKEVPPGTQSSMDGQVAGDLTYEAWLGRQSKSRQIDVLGPGRYELWKKGEVPSFSQLIDQTGRPLTIEELHEKRARS